MPAGPGARQAWPWAWDVVALVAVLVLGFVAVLALHARIRRGPWLHRAITDCDAGGCIVDVPRLLPHIPAHAHDANALRLYVPGVRARWAAYNPSFATIGSGSDGAPVVVATTRLSNYTYCPGTSWMDLLPSVKDEVVVTVNGAPYHVRIPPAWAATLWPPGISQSVGFQDARPVELAPGVVALAVTATLPADGHVPRMALLTLRLPRSPDAGLAVPDVGSDSDAVLTPTAVVLLGPTDGRVQKNWMPFVPASPTPRHEPRRLWLVKHVAPQTNVSLSIAALLKARGVVALDADVELADDPAALALTGTAREPYVWRGSTPLHTWYNDDGDMLLSVVHRRRPGRAGPRYDHAFVTFSAARPHRLLAMSRTFRIEVDGAGFTFVSGLANDALTGDWVLAFGADDCYTSALAFAPDAIRELLRQGPDAPRLTLGAGVTGGRVAERDCR